MGESKMMKNVIGVIVLIFFVGMIMDQCFAVSIKESMKLYNKGKRQYDRENYTEAIDYFRRATTDCPENAMIEVSMYYLGKSYQGAGKNSRAEKTFNDLIEKYKSGKWVKWAKQDLKNIK